MERPISTLALLRGHPWKRYSIPKDVVWSLATGQLRSNWGQPTARVCLCCSKNPTRVYSKIIIIYSSVTSLSLLWIVVLCGWDSGKPNQIKSKPNQGITMPWSSRLLSSQPAATITNISQSRLRPCGHTKLHHQRPQWRIHHTNGTILLPQASQVLA